MVRTLSQARYTLIEKERGNFQKAYERVARQLSSSVFIAQLASLSYISSGQATQLSLRFASNVACNGG